MGVVIGSKIHWVSSIFKTFYCLIDKCDLRDLYPWLELRDWKERFKRTLALTIIAFSKLSFPFWKGVIYEGHFSIMAQSALWKNRLWLKINSAVFNFFFCNTSKLFSTLTCKANNSIVKCCETVEWREKGVFARRCNAAKERNRFYDSVFCGLTVFSTSFTSLQTKILSSRRGFYWTQIYVHLKWCKQVWNILTLRLEGMNKKRCYRKIFHCFCG